MNDFVKQLSEPATTDQEEVSSVSPNGQAHSLDVLALVETIRSGKWTVLAIAIGFFVAAMITASLLPVQYSSKASFIPPTGSSGSSAAALAGQLSSLGASSLLGSVKNSGDLYAGILKSRSIATELVEHFGLKGVYGVKRESDALKRLAANTEVEVGTKDTIVTLTVRDKSPERAKDLANAYLDALRETNGRLALTEAAQRRLFFDQQLAKEKTNLADAEVDLKKTEEQSGLIAPVGQTALEIQTIAATKAQIAARQVELAGLLKSYTEQNPEVIRLQSEIQDLESQLMRLQNGAGKSVSGTIPASQVPGLQLEYVRKEREVKYHEALFEMLAKQYEAAHIDESHDAPLLQVLDSASYPDIKSSPHRTLISLGGLVLGGIFGCVWVIGRKYIQSAGSLFANADTLARGQR
jgi:tyrosine-protein kinase Etk/Wzc